MRQKRVVLRQEFTSEQILVLKSNVFDLITSDVVALLKLNKIFFNSPILKFSFCQRLVDLEIDSCS